MKRFLFTIWVFLAFQLVSVSQTFSEHYGVFEFGWADVARDVEYRNDSIYIFYADQNPEGGVRPCISNISHEGELVWSKCLQRPTTVRGGGGNNFVDVFEDGNRYVAAHGFQTNHDITEEQLWLSELAVYDQNFDTLYTTLVGDSINFFTVRQAKFTPDGGAVMVGWTHTLEPEEGPLNLFLVKFDVDGHEEWQSIHSTFSGSWDTGHSIIPLNNGNYLMGSATKEGWFEPNWPVVTLFDNQGGYIDHIEFGNNIYSEGWANISPLSDGNFIFSSSKQETSDQGMYRIVKFDQDLNILWEKEYYFYSAEVSLVQIKENSDGTLIACGTWEDMITTHDFGTLLKLDSNGNLIWHRLYQHANEGVLQINHLYDVIELPGNEGYIACGQRNGIDNGQNYWVLKVDEMGCLVEGCDTITSVSEFSEVRDLEMLIGPNPTTNFLNVFIPKFPINITATDLVLEIRSSEGKLVDTIEIVNDDTSYIVDLQQYSAGIYSISLYLKDLELSSKKVILK